MNLQRASLTAMAGHIAALLTCVLVAWSSLSALVYDNSAKRGARDGEREILYLPNGDALEALSFGYRNVLGNLLWFKTISYFGKHYAADRNYTWLSHQCHLVSRLIPKAPYVYNFCANMLSWEAARPEQSIQILDRAVTHLPDDWNVRYYRAMTYLVFMKQPAAALEDLRVASHLPNAPAFVKRIAAKTMAEIDHPSTAVEFLEQLLKSESDPNASKALQQKLDDIKAKDLR